MQTTRVTKERRSLELGRVGLWGLILALVAALTVPIFAQAGPHHDLAYFEQNQAVTAYKDGRYEDAVRHARTALRARTDWTTAEARLTLGLALFKLGRFRDAETELIKLPSLADVPSDIVEEAQQGLEAVRAALRDMGREAAGTRRIEDRRRRGANAFTMPLGLSYRNAR